MKQGSLFIFCLIFGMTGFVAAQTKTVTNATLEKYRQERLKAEREYRENHARLGLPSPEEIDRRRQQSFKETEELSAKLRDERLERERIEADRLTRERLAASDYAYNQNVPAPRYYEPPYFYSYFYPQRRRLRTPFTQQGYVGGGQFWPTGPRTRPRPMFRFRQP